MPIDRSESIFQAPHGESRPSEFLEHAVLLQDLLALNAQLQALENIQPSSGPQGGR